MANARNRFEKILREDDFPKLRSSKKGDEKIKALQLQMLRIQQGNWHRKKRVIILFEGFDAAGKGGAIRRLIERLDPRGYRVHPIGPPSADEQGKHYLYRFWTSLPSPGTIAVFDRSWYGRLLVERVEHLTSKLRWQDAYREINEFEKQLTDDGIELIKIFLTISKDEQFKRFEARLKDAYKQWKITPDDIEARAKWEKYVVAAQDLFDETHTKWCPWHIVAANDKEYARLQVLKIVTERLQDHGKWMEDRAEKYALKSIKKDLEALKSK